MSHNSIEYSFFRSLTYSFFRTQQNSETWSEIIDPYYYAAFAWALLDSIANTTVHPPKIRPFREIKCITKIENEAVSLIYRNYHLQLRFNSFIFSL